MTSMSLAEPSRSACVRKEIHLPSGDQSGASPAPSVNGVIWCERPPSAETTRRATAVGRSGSQAALVRAEGARGPPLVGDLAAVGRPDGPQQVAAEARAAHDRAS